ncbi:MAG: MBL fold metallo-hydrolase [Candidatus Micrarchaeia archaeon]
MQIKFLGGAREVGRSAIMVYDDDKTKLLLDYGIKIDRKKPGFPIEIPSVDGVVISHAHMDHSGFVPALLKHRNIPIIGTSSTMKLSELLLEDSLGIAKKEHRQAGFAKEDLRSFSRNFVEVQYKQKTRIRDYEIELFDAGHISGSAVTLLEKRSWHGQKLVYTGDFKLEKQYLHKGAEIIKGDILVMESTYALKEHPNREELVKEFIESIKTVLDNNGTVLLPSFAVGRSQEILSMLYKNSLIDYCYLDGMAQAATAIVLSYPSLISNSRLLSDAFGRATRVASKKDRIDAIKGPSIILTTAGMLEGGPVLNYVQKMSSNSEIMLTGFQAPNTNGRLLLEQHKMVVDKKVIKIKQPVSYYDFSAHAGMSDLYRYARESSPNIIICLHGDSNNAVSLASNLADEGFETYAPKLGQSIEIKL